MRIVGREKLDRFCNMHADCRQWIANWISDAGSSSWRVPQDVKAKYAAASFLAQNVVIFNVRGNEYRLVTTIAYRTGIVVVQWIGTHAEYTKKYR
jgi:mRNA interferase HigB